MRNGDYILVKAPDWYKGKRYRVKYCYEHHLVWEEHTGRPVPVGFIIHHKDGNKTNNKLDNLCCITEHEHKLLHGQDKERTTVLFECPVCKKIVEREKRLCKNKICFCSLQCCGLFDFKHRTQQEKEDVRNKQFIGE